MEMLLIILNKMDFRRDMLPVFVLLVTLSYTSAVIKWPDGTFNVARGKHTEQSSTYNGFDSSRAVDGNSNPRFNDGSCTHTNATNTTWWGVDLGNKFTVYTVALTNRVIAGFRLRKFIIYGSNTALNPLNSPDKVLCWQQDDAVADGTTIKFRCNNKLDVRFISILKIDPSIPDNQHLQLCEVEVETDCPDGEYGFNCTSSCSDNCLHGAPCKKRTGKCPHGCNAGYTEDKCEQECPDNTYGYKCDKCSDRCLHGSCDKFSAYGTCTGGECVPGYVDGGNCSTACPKGSYGRSCLKDCTNKCIEAFCNHINGSCQIGCQDGYSGDMCAKTGPSSIAVIAGILIPGILIILAFVAVFILIKRKSERLKSNVDASFENVDEMQFIEKNGLKTETKELQSKPKALVKPQVPELKPRQKVTIENKTDGQLNMDGIEVQDDSLCIYGNVSNPSHTLVKTGEFQKYLTEKKKKEGKRLFKEEYEAIPSQLALSDQANKKELANKNRYKNILPYDNNTVVLQQVGDDESSTYINASFINDHFGKRTYIAALGATEHTLNDIWRMIWECDVSLVVMLTKLIENSKLKCAQYWPKKGSVSYGDITVNLDQTTVYYSYTIRKMTVSKDNTSHDITHYQYTAWPDKDVPDRLSTLLQIRDVMKVHKVKNKLPILVHCSAGVGRSGTMIALDTLMDQAESESHVDVRMCVTALREQRINMVQTLSQYVFLHNALDEILTVGSTMISCSSLKVLSTADKKLTKEFKFLEKIKPVFNDEMVQLGKFEYKDKNRDMNVIPADNRRLKLASAPEVYINGVYIEGFGVKTKFIATQVPLKTTVHDFWKMIYKEKCPAIVCLQTDPNYTQWLPGHKSASSRISVFGSLSVTVKNIDTDSQHVTVYHITVDKYTDACYANTEAPADSNEDEVNISLFMINGLADGVIENRDVRFLGNLHEHIKKCILKKNIITVICLNGATESGLFIAFYQLLETAHSEEQVDVFSVVKKMRNTRPQFIPTQAQFTLLHRMLQANLISEEDSQLYRN